MTEDVSGLAGLAGLVREEVRRTGEPWSRGAVADCLVGRLPPRHHPAPRLQNLLTPLLSLLSLHSPGAVCQEGGGGGGGTDINERLPAGQQSLSLSPSQSQAGRLHLLHTLQTSPGVSLGQTPVARRLAGFSSMLRARNIYLVLLVAAQEVRGNDSK